MSKFSRNWADQTELYKGGRHYSPCNMHASGRGLASVLKESTGQLGDKTNTPDWGIKSPERRDTKKRGGLERQQISSLSPALKEGSWKYLTSQPPHHPFLEAKPPGCLTPRMVCAWEDRAWTAFSTDSNVWGPPSMAL